MTENTITENEADTLRAIAYQADEVDNRRIAVARDDSMGDGSLSRRAATLMEASMILDGMVTVAEKSGLFSRAGRDVRILVLSGRAPYDDDFAFYEVTVSDS